VEQLPLQCGLITPAGSSLARSLACRSYAACADVPCTCAHSLDAHPHFHCCRSVRLKSRAPRRVRHLAPPRPRAGSDLWPELFEPALHGARPRASLRQTRHSRATPSCSTGGLPTGTAFSTSPGAQGAPAGPQGAAPDGPSAAPRSPRSGHAQRAATTRSEQPPREPSLTCDPDLGAAVGHSDVWPNGHRCKPCLHAREIGLALSHTALSWHSSRRRQCQQRPPAGETRPDLQAEPGRGARRAQLQAQQAACAGCGRLKRSAHPQHRRAHQSGAASAAPPAAPCRQQDCLLHGLQQAQIDQHQ
jgi:hypothetical protein